METPRARSRKIQPTTLEEFKQIDAIANPRDRALLRFMKDSGLSTEDVVVFNYGDIKREFEEGKDFIHIRAVRQKTQVNYDTFIGPNAVEALRIYFRLRKANGEVLNDKSPLFLSHGKRKGKKRGDVKRLDDNSIRTIFTRLKNRIGIVVSPHRIRKLFASYMGLKVRHPAVLKHWMGHSVETSDVEGRYVIPPLEEQRKLYMESYEQIDIRQKGASEREQQIDNLINFAIAQGLPHEKVQSLRTIFRAKAVSPQVAAVEIRKELEKIGGTKESSTDCADGQHCQRVVAEDQLETMLVKGWRVAAVLPSGKIVVTN
jgi:hypothetical protein